MAKAKRRNTPKYHAAKRPSAESPVKAPASLASPPVPPALATHLRKLREEMVRSGLAAHLQQLREEMVQSGLAAHLQQLREQAIRLGLGPRLPPASASPSPHSPSLLVPPTLAAHIQKLREQAIKLGPAFQLPPELAAHLRRLCRPGEAFQLPLALRKQIAALLEQTCKAREADKRRLAERSRRWPGPPIDTRELDAVFARQDYPLGRAAKVPASEAPPAPEVPPTPNAAPAWSDALMKRAELELPPQRLLILKALVKICPGGVQAKQRATKKLLSHVNRELAASGPVESDSLYRVLSWLCKALASPHDSNR